MSEKPSEQELNAVYRARQSELQSLSSKLSELERDMDEHILVIETVKEASEADKDRKAFRLIGGILVERTVGEVLPDLMERHDQIKELMDALTKEYKRKETEFLDWQKEHKIVVKSR